MPPLLAALLLAVALWWLGTGVVLYLQQRLRPGGAGGIARVALGVGAAAAAAVVALLWSATRTDAVASVTGFVAAIVLWGALELSHYLGLVTGTHERRCPAGLGGWSRFRLALGTSIWHELSVLGAGLALVALLGHAPNPAGLHTFLVLWLMRWSAKLNLFFGVPNFSTEWFPERLGHLASYVRRAPVSALFPVSLTAATLVVIALAHLALETPGTAALAHALPATLLALAVLEHVLMALPVAETRLWNRLFGLPRADTDAPKPPPAPTPPPA